MLSTALNANHCHVMRNGTTSIFGVFFPPAQKNKSDCPLAEDCYQYCLRLAEKNLWVKPTSPSTSFSRNMTIFQGIKHRLPKTAWIQQNKKLQHKIHLSVKNEMTFPHPPYLSCCFCSHRKGLLQESRFFPHRVFTVVLLAIFWNHETWWDKSQPGVLCNSASC